MADEDAELIGGISVSVGASHRQLASDLAEADRQLEAWAKQRFVVQIGAQVAQPSAQPRAAAQPQAPAVSFGPGSATRAQAQQSQTALQRAINAELAKTGEMFNAQTGEIESATAAVQRQRTVIADVQATASEPIALNIDTKAIQDGLQEVLASLRQIAVEAQSVNRVQLAIPIAEDDEPSPTGGGGRRRKGLKRRNINPRDIGTAADTGRVYTFDPAVYEEEDRKREAASARQREALIQQQTRRAEQQATLTARQRVAQDRARAANALNNLPPVGQSRTGAGITDINDPNYKPDEVIERQRAAPARDRAQAQQQIAQQRRQAEAAAVQARRNAFDVSQSAATAAAFRQSARVRQFQIDEEQQARIVNARRAAITGSGRTSRTLASGLGALFGGTEQRQIEAQAAASQAARALSSAERAIEPLDNRLRDLARAWQTSTGENRQFNREQFLAIRRSDEYRGAISRVREAVVADADAQERLNKISSGTSVIRNLAAITAAGAGFGLALRGVDLATAVLGKGLDNIVDIQTGFIGTSSRVTSALAQQARQMNGNAAAAIAAAEAQAGFSTRTAQAITPTIQLATQVKSGALAQQDFSDLFRAGVGANGASNGLVGGFGGLFGGSLFAQQLGGGRGFSELVNEDIGAIAPRNTASRPFDIGQVPGGLGDLVSSLNPFGQNFGAAGYRNSQGQLYGSQGAPSLPPEQVKNLNVYLGDLNDAASRGAVATGSLNKTLFVQTDNTDQLARAYQVAKDAGNDYIANLAETSHVVVTVNGQLANSAKQLDEALRNTAIGQGIPDTAQLARANLAAERQRQRESAASLDVIRAQQAFALPAQIAAVNRQQQYTLNTQLPAQAALGALANPNQPVGTGIAVEDQKKVAASLAESVGLQKQLNDYYDQGKQILIDTYKVPPQLVASVERVGQAIAATQASISNEQAAYQVAQYNFQLQIAKRNLADIGGLTGQNFGAGQSYLGVLERQNLELSRQGQLLQFALSQRQINFQTALAGFQAPGVTPEERQARIEEAQIEASFAQKQLDIQKQIFGNQVQIVDISNLRQGADLAKQIGLLLQGRKVTIDTAAAEQRLLRLQQLQQQQVAQVGTYLNRVDSLTAQAFSNIQQLESAAGKAMSGVATDVLRQFGIVIVGLSDSLNNLNSGGGGGGPRPKPLASGGVLTTNGPTRIGDQAIAGEVADETVLVLARPRAANGFSGGGSNYFDFSGMVVRNDADIDLIVRKVTQALGREASVKGLRGIG